MSVVRAIGLMSGTSLDGVDVALIETDGERIAHFGPSGYRPYADAEQALLRQALEQGAALHDRAARSGVLAEAEAFVTRVHAEPVEAFLEAERIDKAQVAIVGFHGQTVLLRPGQKLTVQIGDGAALARRLGIPVAYDFRAADVAAGGQGAPLVPVFHQALARGLDKPHPIAVLNVGGVANVTFVDGGDPIACDTGPGNALIDDFMRAHTGAPLDRNAFAFANIGLPDFRGGWRGDAVGADRGVSGAHRAPSAAAAARLDRGGRRRAQSDTDAHAFRVACTGERGNRRRHRLVVAGDRGAGLCLSGGAHDERPADYVSANHRGGAADARGSGGAAVTVTPRSACVRSSAACRDSRRSR